MKKRIFALLLGTLFLVSCSGDEITEKPAECPPPVPQEYKLVSIDFEPDPAGFTVIPGEPEVFRFTNNWKEVATNTYRCERKRIESSLFELPDKPLPAGSNINEILANVPNTDGEPKIIGMSVPKFKFSFGTQQLYQQEIVWPLQTVNLGPYSITTVTERYIGYGLKATYHAILENIYSGERIELTGKWEGMKQTNGETVLKEEQLNS